MITYKDIYKDNKKVEKVIKEIESDGYVAEAEALRCGNLWDEPIVIEYINELFN